jgi:hypothetical protein
VVIETRGLTARKMSSREISIWNFFWRQFFFSPFFAKKKLRLSLKPETWYSIQCSSRWHSRNWNAPKKEEKISNGEKTRSKKMFQFVTYKICGYCNSMYVFVCKKLPTLPWRDSTTRPIDPV